MHSLNDESSIMEENSGRKNPSRHVSHDQSSRPKPLTHRWRYPGCAGVTA